MTCPDCIASLTRARDLLRAVALEADLADLDGATREEVVGLAEEIARLAGTIRLGTDEEIRS
jgi:hypothetical protein